MEKTFRLYESNPAARRAFVESEAGAFVAHQIRVLRAQRNWSQTELAERMGTSPSVISRLEDSQYGRISFQTMVDLAHAFDVAPVLMFKSTIELMKERWVVDRKAMEVLGFEEEAPLVAVEDGRHSPPAIGNAAGATVQLSMGSAAYAVVPAGTLSAATAW